MTALAALILAAGAGTRMGQPKALLRWRGRSFARCAVDLALAADCDPVLVVEGAASLPADELRPARVVRNDAWPEGQTSSLRCGLAVLGAGAPVLVLSVDRPHVHPATVLALAAAARADPTSIWQPLHAGRHGHPILYPPAVIPLLLALPPGATPRDLLTRAEVAARRRFVPVDDPTVLDNLDHPGDLARLP